MSQLGEMAFIACIGQLTRLRILVKVNLICGVAPGSLRGAGIVDEYPSS